MGLFLLSLGLFGAAFFFYWLSQQQLRKAQAIKLTSTTSIAQLTDICGSVAQELGAGSFRQMVKLRGRPQCQTPLTSEISQSPCLYYSAKVIREYEVLVWEKDTEGREIQRSRRDNEIVASNQRSTEFFLDDGTGKLLVKPEGAQIEGTKVRSEFQPAHTSLRVGSFQIDFTTVPGGTLGYRYEEEILPLESELSLVAEASDATGALALCKPENHGDLFLISPKNFEELASGRKTLQSLFFALSVGLAIVGAGILILGVIR